MASPLVGAGAREAPDRKAPRSSNGRIISWSATHTSLCPNRRRRGPGNGMRPTCSTRGRGCLTANPERLQSTSSWSATRAFSPGEGGDRSVGGHHGAFPNAVISKPELPGLRRPVPDFMWITKVSGLVYPVMIEIETPAKKWFTAAGIQTHALSQAVAVEALPVGRSMLPGRRGSRWHVACSGVTPATRAYRVPRASYCGSRSGPPLSGDRPSPTVGRSTRVPRADEAARAGR
jgi:hypothetical protein